MARIEQHLFAVVLMLVLLLGNSDARPATLRSDCLPTSSARASSDSCSSVQSGLARGIATDHDVMTADRISGAVQTGIVSDVSNTASFLNSRYNLSWVVTPAAGKSEIDGDATISLTIVAVQDAWVGIGFNNVEFDSMALSDVYAGWALANGSVVLKDFKVGTASKGTCELNGLCADTVQSCTDDILHAEGTYVPSNTPGENGTMTITFTRKLVTGDERCDVPITPGEVYVVAAMGRNGAPTQQISYHGRDNREAAKIVFYNAPAAPGFEPEPSSVPTTTPTLVTPPAEMEPVVSSPVVSSPVVSSPEFDSSPSHDIIYQGSQNMFPGFDVSWTVYSYSSEAISMNINGADSSQMQRVLLDPYAQIEVTVVAKTDAWAGFGFNLQPNNMPHSDVYVAVRGSGEGNPITVGDFLIGSKRKRGCANPDGIDGVCPDTQQSCQNNILASSSSYEPPQNGAPTGTMRYTFRRLLRTGDGCDVDIGYGETNVVAAMSEVNSQLGIITFHGDDNYESKKIKLLGEEPTPPTDASPTPINAPSVTNPPEPQVPGVIFQSSVDLFQGHHVNWTVYAKGGSLLSSSSSHFNALLDPTAEIEFTITAKTDAWAGFGWNPARDSMRGSDAYIGVRYPNGSIIVGDYKLGQETKVGCPKDGIDGICLDVDRQCQSNIISSQASYIPPASGDVTGTLIVTVRRLLNTGDNYCDYPIRYGLMHVVGAMSKPGAPLGVITGHGAANHGTASILLIGNDPNSPQAPPVAPVAPPTPVAAAPPCDHPPTAGEFEHEYLALSGRYKLYWTIKPVNNDFTIAFTAKGTGWVGFGISTASGDMVGSEAIIGWPGSVESYQLSSKRVSGILPDPAIPLTGICSMQYKDTDGSTWTMVKASRKVVAGANPIAINSGETTPVVVAIGPPGQFKIVAHNDDDKEQLKIDFTSGAVKVAGPNPLKVAHGALMFVGWGVIVQFGAFFARYAKPLPNALWFKVHRVIQLAGFLLTVIGFILALVMTKPPHFRTPNGHAQIGLTVMILGIIQIIVALFRPNPASVGQNKSIIRVLWEYSHWWIGRIAMVLAVAGIFLGLNSISAPFGFTVAWAVIVGISCAGIAILELYRKFAIDRPQQAYEFVKLNTTDSTN